MATLNGQIIIPAARLNVDNKEKNCTSHVRASISVHLIMV